MRNVGRGTQETVKHRCGGDEEGEDEDERSNSIAVLPPALPGVTAGDDAYDGNQAGGWDVKVFEKPAEY